MDTLTSSQASSSPIFADVGSGASAARLLRIARTARDTEDRLAELAPAGFGEAPDCNVSSVMVDLNCRYQKIVGFGGAFTEAAATTLYKLSPAKRAQVLNACFDEKTGHGYSLCRTHMNSCDFALGNYAYSEVPGDMELKHFSIERDRQALIPMIKEAMSLARGDLKLFASPWSPPAWMKTTGAMNHGGKLRKECRDVWARYYCRYIREYEREGLPIWGLTVQNEPEATQTWDSCVYTGEEERDFVRDHLGPALHRAGLGAVRLMIWDHNRDRMFERAKVVFDDPKAAGYVWGTAFHWYMGDCFENCQLVHEAWPDKHLIFTEGCVEKGPHIGSWSPAEKYGLSIIRDLNHWTEGWVDWNLLLDETGGPNHVDNFCGAPIICDTRADKVFFQSSFYYLGHFARFIRPGAERVLCASSRDELEATAFQNDDAGVVVVVLNRSDKSIPFALKFGREAAQVESLPHSIMTLRF
jgi:glucosylceramidase